MVNFRANQNKWEKENSRTSDESIPVDDAKELAKLAQVNLSDPVGTALNSGGGVANAISITRAYKSAQEKGLDGMKAAKAQAEYNKIQAEKFIIDYATSDILGIPVPTKSFYAATKGDVDKKYGRAYNVLQVALGTADELGKTTDRNKAFTEPKLNRATGKLEFDPSGEALVQEGFDKAGLSPEAQEAKWAELMDQRTANTQLAKLYNDGIPIEFARLGRTPLEQAQLLANAQGLQAQGDYLQNQKIAAEADKANIFGRDLSTTGGKALTPEAEILNQQRTTGTPTQGTRRTPQGVVGNPQGVGPILTENFGPSGLQGSKLEFVGGPGKGFVRPKPPTTPTQATKPSAPSGSFSGGFSPAGSTGGSSQLSDAQSRLTPEDIRRMKGGK